MKRLFIFFGIIINFVIFHSYVYSLSYFPQIAGIEFAFLMFAVFSLIHYFIERKVCSQRTKLKSGLIAFIMAIFSFVLIILISGVMGIRPEYPTSIKDRRVDFDYKTHLEEKYRDYAILEVDNGIDKFKLPLVVTYEEQTLPYEHNLIISFYGELSRDSFSYEPYTYHAWKHTEDELNAWYPNNLGNQSFFLDTSIQEEANSELFNVYPLQKELFSKNASLYDEFSLKFFVVGSKEEIANKQTEHTVKLNNLKESIEKIGIKNVSIHASYFTTNEEFDLEGYVKKEMGKNRYCAGCVTDHDGSNYLGLYNDLKKENKKLWERSNIGEEPNTLAEKSITKEFDLIISSETNQSGTIN